MVFGEKYSDPKERAIKVISRRRVSPVPATGELSRWLAWMSIFYLVARRVASRTTSHLLPEEVG